MKTIFFKSTLFCVFLLLCGTILAQEKIDAYFTTAEMPDLINMPFSPPTQESAAFSYDISRYFWGKQMRQDPVRSAIAIRDAVYGLQTIINEFSIPFGVRISEEETPEIYELLKVSLATCDSICTIPKKYWSRVRPFIFFNETTLTPADEPALRKNFSYPSGHTILGYSAALLLTEINPERADTLMSRGIMYGESRVICGAHWQSDVDAGMLAASIAVAKLHTSDRFLKQMEEAKKEFKKIKSKRPLLETDKRHKTPKSNIHYMP